LGATLLLVFLGFSPWGLAEEAPGDIVSTRRETELRKEPYPDAESLGILPVKSIVTLLGEEKGRFVQVEVELEEGSLTGWVEISVVRRKKKAEEESPEPEVAEEEPAKKVIPVKKYQSKKKKKRIAIPQDEGLLLKRDSTFSYGAVVGGHLDMIRVEVPESDFSGNGFSLGATVSFVLDPNFRLRTELVYSNHSGIDSNERMVAMGFMDLSALGEVPLTTSFSIFGGIQYSFGIGLDNEAQGIDPQTLETASELSGFWAQGGLGYRFSVGEQSYLTLRGRYAGALMTSPLAIHTFGLQLVWEIEG